MARQATGQVLVRKGTAGRTYALRFRAYGRRHYLTLGTDAEGWDRRRAEVELENVLADARRGIWKPQERLQAVEPTPEPTFHEFASEWMEEVRPELRPRTAEDYEWALTHHLLPFFAEHRLSEVTVEEVDRYRRAKLRQGSLANNTLNKTITRLGQILELAVEYGHLTANPARGRRRRAKAERPRRTWLEPEQVAPLLQAAGELDAEARSDDLRHRRALLSTLVLAGLRIGELIDLRWRDVDLAAGRLHVGRAKTDAGLRHVDLSPALREELTAYKMSTPYGSPGELVFPTRKGEPQDRNNIRSRTLAPALTRANTKREKADLPPLPEALTPHSLRHTFASLLFEAGATVPYVMAQLGHSDPKVTLTIYSHVLERKRDHGERLDALVRGAEWAQTGTNPLSELPASEPATASEQEKTPPERGFRGVGRAGLEPATSSLSSWRSPY